jgi:hypothetical protein
VREGSEGGDDGDFVVEDVGGVVDVVDVVVGDGGPNEALEGGAGGFRSGRLIPTKPTYDHTQEHCGMGTV